MSKFCVLSLGLLLCLTGCKDFKEFQKNQISETKKKINSQKSSLSDGKILDPIFEEDKNKKNDEKWLMDEAESWGLTNLETLGMTLDSTTRDQAIDILNSRGYAVILPEIGILEKVGLAELCKKSLEKYFAKGLPSAELLCDGIKSLRDRLKKSSIILVVNEKFAGKWDNLNLVKDPDIMKDLIAFIFDENKKLIIFFKQYPKNKEAELVKYEAIMGLSVDSKGEKKPTYILRKDQSCTIVGKKDPKATSYAIFAPSIVGKHVGAFKKTYERYIRSKELEEYWKKEDEYAKNFVHLPKKEFIKKLKEFRNSKEHKERNKKINEKLFQDYLKNLEANR